MGPAENKPDDDKPPSKPLEFSGDPEKDPERRRIILVASDGTDETSAIPALKGPEGAEANGEKYTKWALTFREDGDDWCESLNIYLSFNARFGHDNKIREHIFKPHQKHFPDTDKHKIKLGKELISGSEWKRMDPKTTAQKNILMSVPFALERIEHRTRGGTVSSYDKERMAAFLREATVYATKMVKDLQQIATDGAVHAEGLRQLRLCLDDIDKKIPSRLIERELAARFPSLAAAQPLEATCLAEAIRHVNLLKQISAQTWSGLIEDFTFLKVVDVFNRGAGKPSLFPKRPAGDNTEIIIKGLKQGDVKWMVKVPGNSSTLAYRDNVSDASYTDAAWPLQFH